MLRRFEIYGVPHGADHRSVRALETACARCGRFIPEVLHSAVGWSVSDTVTHLVWEHAFSSPEAYRRYMIHPYHAAVLDRYLLHDSPERVVADDDLGAGLVGYACPGPEFALPGGLRRVVLLRLSRHAPESTVHELVTTLGRASQEVDQMVLSVVGDNTLGPAWFDGVTPITGRPRWTHIWEQGFSGVDELAAYLDDGSWWADAERRGWAGSMEGIVERAVSLEYEIGAPRPGPG